jgi:hypothetical protein
MTQALRPAEDEQAASARASRRRTQGRQGHPRAAFACSQRQERTPAGTRRAGSGWGRGYPASHQRIAVLVRIVRNYHHQLEPRQPF